MAYVCLMDPPAVQPPGVMEDDELDLALLDPGTAFAQDPNGQGATITDQYDQDSAYLVSRSLTPEGASEAPLKVAVDLRDREEVAIRLLARGSPVGTSGLSFTALERSLPIHARLHHPNIIGLKKVFLSEQQLGIAYEHATHGSLKETLRNYGPFSEKFARFFFQQLMCGVSYCHESGVAHNSLKLSNLLLRVFSTSNGAAPVLKIAGFEHAVKDPFVTAPTRPTRGGPRPNSPPRAVKATTTIQESKVADVMACGVLLYTMLTGTSPFTADDTKSSSSQALPGTSSSLSIDWPRNCLPSLSCQDLVEQMLEADPLKRISVDDVLRHAWYQTDLPRELQGGGRGLAHCQMRRCEQPGEEIKELLRQAKHAPTRPR